MAINSITIKYEAEARQLYSNIQNLCKDWSGFCHPSHPMTEPVLVEYTVQQIVSKFAASLNKSSI